MRFTINWRFLVKLIVVVVILAIPVHFLHRYQVRKQVDIFLRYADEARDSKDFGREVNFLRRYLMARPNDIDNRDRLARTLCSSAKTRRDVMEGYLTAEDVLRRDDSRDDLRRFVADFALRVGLYTEARGHIEKLLEDRPNDGELEGLYAHSLAAQGKYGESNADPAGAWHWYERSISHRKDLLESYAGLAQILRSQSRRPEEADRRIAQMLGVDLNDPTKKDPEAEKNLKNHRAFLYLAYYWQSLNQPGDSVAIAARAVAEAQYSEGVPESTTVRDAIENAASRAEQLAPDELEVILLSANVARDRAREFQEKEGVGGRKKVAEALERARKLLARGIELHPTAETVYLAAAQLEPADRAIAIIRKGLEAIPKSEYLTRALLDNQISAGDAEAAGTTLDELKKAGLSPAFADYFTARILALRGQWLDASRILESIRDEVAGDPRLSQQVHFLLARCYTQIGRRDNALVAFNRALPTETSDPMWVPVMFAIAETQTALGQVDAALAAYRLLKDHGKETWIPILQLEVLRVLQEADKQKDWTAVRKVRDEADKHYQKRPEDQVPTQYLVLRAELEALSGNHEAAWKALLDLRGKRPKEAAVWLAMAAQERAGNPKAAEATLDKMQTELGDSPDLRVARARLWVAMKEPDLAVRLKPLTENLDQFPAADRQRLLRELAGLADKARATELADATWQRLAALQPDDFSIKLALFDRALTAGKLDAATAIQAEIGRIDGETGPFTRFAQAIVLLSRAEAQKDLSGLDEARELLEGVEQERPRWGRVALALATLHYLRGEFDEAIEKYGQALDAGATDPVSLRRHLDLLVAKGRIDDAKAVLKKLGDSAALDASGQRLAAEVQLQTGNMTAAVEAAIKAVPADSKDPKEQLWLGQMLWAARDDEKAEVALRKATELDPASTEGWLTLIQLLSTSNRKDEAIKVLETAKDRVAKAEQSLFLALAYSQLDDREQAAAAFKKASTERPDHLRTAQAEAEFHFRSGDLKEAREGFERVVNMESASPENREQALQMLAIAFATDQDPETRQRALEVLKLLKIKDGKETPAQKRTRALVLALRADRNSKLEAIRLLEEMREILNSNDLFLLGRLHVEVGNRPQARLVMGQLLRRPDAAKVPLYLAFYSTWLLREGDIAEAKKWIDQLRAVQKDSLQTAVLDARLLAKQGELPKARAILLKRAEPEKAPVGTLAGVCEELGLFDDAEQLLKRYVAENQASRPEVPLALAEFYGRRDRLDEALRICESVPASVPASTVGEVAVNALYLAKSPSSGQVTRVASWLEAAAAKAQGPTRAAVLQQLATVRNLQGDYTASIDQYRRAVANNPKDALALNNLAFFVSVLEKKHDEALRLIEQAKSTIGPNPDLLDTEAMIRLNKGELDAARKLLEQVVASSPKNATAYFHLALVEQAAKRDLDARLAWKRANDLGFKRDDLHPLERPSYDQLSRDLK